MMNRLPLILDALVMTTALVVGVGSTFVAALGPMPAGAGQVVLVIVPPWAERADRLIRQSGGQTVGPVTAPFGALALYDTTPPVDRLVAMGAWTVRDARAIASLCGAST